MVAGRRRGVRFVAPQALGGVEYMPGPLRTWAGTHAVFGGHHLGERGDLRVGAAGALQHAELELDGVQVKIADEAHGSTSKSPGPIPGQ